MNHLRVDNEADPGHCAEETTRNINLKMVMSLFLCGCRLFWCLTIYYKLFHLVDERLVFPLEVYLESTRGIVSRGQPGCNTVRHSVWDKYALVGLVGLSTWQSCVPCWACWRWQRAGGPAQCSPACSTSWGLWTHWCRSLSRGHKSNSPPGEIFWLFIYIQVKCMLNYWQYKVSTK